MGVGVGVTNDGGSVVLGVGVPSVADAVVSGFLFFASSSLVASL